MIRILPTKKFGVFGFPESLCLQACAIEILECPNLHEKVRLTEKYLYEWTTGLISEVFDANSIDRVVPHEPSREINETVEALGITAVMKLRGLNKNSIEISLHGIAHAESWALELFWDIIARFRHENMPREFYEDMVRIAGQEAAHFKSWAKRLEELNCPYGSLPTHNGLWRAAEATTDSLLHRLLSINLIHEARGLDTFPLTRARFTRIQDTTSDQILLRNYSEEITHVQAGVKWFQFLCARDSLDPKNVFHELFPTYYKGNIKDCNIQARRDAGMPDEWLLPFL